MHSVRDKRLGSSWPQCATKEVRFYFIFFVVLQNEKRRRQKHEPVQTGDFRRKTIFFFKLAVFILSTKDASSFWTNLGNHLYLVWLCVLSTKKGTRRIIHQSRRTISRDASFKTHFDGCDLTDLIRLILRPRPHNAGGIWKRSFISPVRPSDHTNPEKLSIDNGAFRKLSWKRINLKTELCVLVWTENILKRELFEKRWRHDNHLTCLPLKHKSKMAAEMIKKMKGNNKAVSHVGSTKTLLCACSRVQSSVLPPVIAAFSNVSDVVWKENILSLF